MLNDGYQLIHNKNYPNITENFAHSIKEGFNFISDKDEHGILMSIKIGKFGRKIANSISEIAGLLDKKEFNIIIDEVLLGDESLKNDVETLSQSIVYFVAVYCDNKTLEEREILRGDRLIGSGRDQINRCHGSTRKYDIEVDTTHHSSFDCAKQILNFINKENDPKGFKILKDIFFKNNSR